MENNQQNILGKQPVRAERQDIQPQEQSSLNNIGQEKSFQQTSASNLQQQVQVPSFGELFKTAWKIFRNRFWSFVVLSSLPIITIYLFSFLPNNLPTGLAIVLSILLFLFPIVFTFISLFGIMALIEKKEIGLLGAIKNGISWLFPVLWITIITYLAILGAFLPLIIPGYIVIVALSLSLFVLYFENIRGIKALIRSVNLTNGYKGVIFFRQFMFSAFAFILFLPSIVLPFFLSKESAEFVVSIYNSIVVIILTPLSIIINYLIYKTLIGNNNVVQGNKQKIYKFLPIWGLLILLGIIGGVYSLYGTKSDQNNNVNTMISNTNIQTSLARVRDARRISDLNEYTTALMLYYGKNNSYPISTNMSKSTDPDFVLKNIFSKQQLLSDILNDPLVNSGWYYGYQSDASSYELTTRLEDTKSQYCDPEILKTSRVCLYRLKQNN